MTTEAAGMQTATDLGGQTDDDPTAVMRCLRNPKENTMQHTHQAESNTRIPAVQHHASQQAQLLAGLALFAIVCKVILLASAWLLPFVSEYSLVGDNISELVLGRFGVIQTVAFVLSGLGTLGLAWAMYRLTRGLWGSIVGSILIGLYGISALIAAVFPTDRIDSPADLANLSTTGMVHSGAALVGFICIIIGMFVLTRTLMQAGWRTFARWTALLPASALALLFVQGEGPLVGLLQRTLVTATSLWLLAVAFMVRNVAVAAETSTP
ncbi:MAG: DUF998 domain-containing protein [Caldilineaceae bacterium]